VPANELPNLLPDAAADPNQPIEVPQSVETPATETPAAPAAPAADAPAAAPADAQPATP
jgi:hypothetical protein